MGIKESDISEFFGGRVFLALVLAALAVVAVFDAGLPGVGAVRDAGGVFLQPAWGFVPAPYGTTVVNVSCIVASMLLLQLLNKVFRILQGVTSAMATAFLLLQLGNVQVLTGPATAGVMCLATTVMCFAVFASFQQPQSQRAVFFVMALTTLGVLMQWHFLCLVPVMLVGFAIMRALNFRSVLAALVGVATPLWIVLGLGIVGPRNFYWPDISCLWATPVTQADAVALVTAAVTVLATIALTAVNMVQTISFKRQMRAYNGFFIVTSLVASALLALDYPHLSLYLPLLHLGLAVQVGHFYTISHSQRRYALMAVLTLAVAASHALQAVSLLLFA